MSDDGDWQLVGEQRPPDEVTPAVFAAWGAARRGTGNPTVMTNPVWTWLARQPEITAYQAVRHFGARAPGPPTWTNQRFGQSCTTLPDGRVVRIAGEHEDYYDPDFFIYNDVQVTEPDGALTIFGYPPDVFPPTDFHSATSVGDALIVIGNLGYAPQRDHERTQVLRLEIRGFTITPVVTTGDSPGWLHGHTATAAGDAVTIRGGQREVVVGGRTVLRDNCDDYVLALSSGRWTRTTDRRWRSWEIVRADGARGALWDVAQLAYYRGQPDPDDPWAARGAAAALGRIGFEPDLEAWAERFAPPVATTAVARDPDAPDGWRTHAIVIDGVTVRYREDAPVRLIVEGALPAATLGMLLADLVAKLARVERTAYRAVSLDD